MANDAGAPGMKPRFRGSNDGGPSMEAILFSPASILARVSITESAERIISSISLLSRLQLKPISIAVWSLSPEPKVQERSIVNQLF